VNLPERSRNPRPGDLLEVAVDSIADGGLGRGRWAALVGPDRRPVSFDVRVRGALPGEKVELRMHGRRRRVLSGEVTRLLEISSDRIEPRCSHAWHPDRQDPACGGCSLQGLDYARQLVLKGQWVRDQLKANGFDSDLVERVIPCQPPWGHRNKMEYSFGDAGGDLGLGLHPPRRRYEVVDLARCHLQSDEASTLVRAVAEWARAEGLQAHNERRRTGWLRTLLVREGKRTGQRLAELVTGEAEQVQTRHGERPAAQVAQAFADFVAGLRQAVPIDSLYWTQRYAQRGQRTRMEEHLLAGQPHLQERLRLPGGRELLFDVHPRAFFQPNTRQAEVLYGRVMDAVVQGDAPISGRVLDLYCGTGTIGLCLAPAASEVVGIEMQPDAVEDARRNAVRNGVDNARFICGDVGEALASEEFAGLCDDDVAVVDPPRSGLLPAALRLVAGLAASRLVYVSCNPAALARDAVALRKAGYRLVGAEPVDMFPHAWHIETVARFVR